MSFDDPTHRITVTFDVNERDLATLIQFRHEADSRGPAHDLDDLIEEALYEDPNGPMIAGTFETGKAQEIEQ